MFVCFFLQDLKLQLKKLEQEQANWEKKASKGIADSSSAKLTPKMKLKLQNETQKRQKEQNDILEKALFLKFECKI